MVKLAGPAMSLDASGKLGGAVVFTKWKGRNVLRTLVTPANPKSVKQVSVRAMFKFLSQYWTNLLTAERATWNDRADVLKASPFNAFVSGNMSRWRGFLPPHKQLPVTAEGTPANVSGYFATGGVRMCTVGWTVDNELDGWGMGVFRTDETPCTPSFDNCIAMVPCQGAGSYVYVDTPLAAGSYRYNWMKFTDDGVFAAASGETGATVTDS